MSLSAQPRLEIFRRKMAGAIAGPVVRWHLNRYHPGYADLFGFIVVLSSAGYTGAGYNTAVIGNTCRSCLRYV